MDWILLAKVIIQALPVLVRIINLFYKTPAEKWEALSGRLLNLTTEVKDATEVGRKAGDYSALESVLNRDS